MNRQENTQSIIKALDEIMKDDKTLLPLQRDVLEQFKTAPIPQQTGIFDLATGFGKTCIMGILLTAYLKNNPTGKVVIAVPTRTLIENRADGGHIERLQNFFKAFNQRFSSDSLDIGAFYSERKEPEKQVVITTYNSLANLRDEIIPEDVGLLLLDEAHHTITEKRIAAVKSFSNAAQYGLTATPYYSPDKSLSMVLGNTIAQIDVKKAIEQGLLSNVKNVLMVSDISIDLASELGYKQDYTEEDYKNAVEKALKASSNTKSGNSHNPRNWQEFRQQIAKNVAKLYRDYVDDNLGPLNGKQCIINCRTQEEARIQARRINALFRREVAGWWTSDSKDETALNRFRQKQLNVLCQVGRLTEGYDDPDAQICINYPTISRVLEAQRSGRVLHKVQNTNKEALVIDICFKHPDFDNEVDAIRQNKQKLYMDILGAPVVRCEDIALEQMPPEQQYSSTGRKRAVLPNLHGFHIVRDSKELVRLSKEADILDEQRQLAPIRPGMLTSTKLHEKYGTNSETTYAWLKEALEKKLFFYLDSDVEKQNPIPLVEWVKSGIHSCPALHEAPEAIKRFEHLHPLLLHSLKNKDLPEIREGMLTSKGLYKEYGTDAKTTGLWLQEAFDKGAVFYLDSDTKYEHPILLVEQVKAGTQSCKALHEAPEAKKAFERLHPELLEAKKNKELPEIRPGMLTSVGLRRQYGTSERVVCKLLKEAFDKKEVFYFDSDTDKKNPVLLVEHVKTRGRPCHALHQAPEAQKRFEQLYPQLLDSKENREVPQIREGMLTSKKLCKEYGSDIKAIAKWLQEDFDNEEVFFLDSDTEHQYPISLVEHVRAGKQPCNAICEAPEAQKAFEKLHPELLEAQRIRELPQIREGMLTSVGLHQHYGIDRKTALPLLQQAYEKKEVFFLDSDSKKQNPILLVEEVKSGVHPCKALNEAPEARKRFEELHPEILKTQQTMDLLPIQEGMLTSKDLYKRYKAKNGGEPVLWLQRAFDDGAIFYLDSDTQHQHPLPLVKWVKSGPHPCKVLHEAPEAIPAFEAWYQKTFGKELNKRPTPSGQGLNVVLSSKENT